MIPDLHCHSTASDGALTPLELVTRAIEKRVSLLALTDHDTIEGSRAALAHVAAAALPIRIIPGVELSTRWHGLEIHLVGLNFDPDSPELAQLLARQQAARRERATAIALKLEKNGIPDCHAAALALAGSGEVTRAHFARVLVAKGAVSSMEQAFKKYLRKGKKAYVAPRWVSLADAIKFVQDAGGVAVLAHPTKYDLSWKWVEKLISEFAEAGGDALEVAMCQQFPNERRKLADLADQFSLAASQGSDFHHPNSWIELGKNLWLPAGASPVWEPWQTEDECAEVKGS